VLSLVLVVEVGSGEAGNSGALVANPLLLWLRQGRAVSPVDLESASRRHLGDLKRKLKVRDVVFDIYEKINLPFMLFTASSAAKSSSVILLT
jgi:hypothetical protein